jgi:hypothetical protein
MSADEPSVAEQAQRDWEALRSVGELFPGTALEESSRELGAQGGWPEDLTGTPVVLAEPDEVSLTAAARNGQDLALVITPDVDAVRSALARLGRGDVAVTEPENTASQLAAIMSATDRPVRWIGTSQPTALIALLDSASELVARLRVTQLQAGTGASALLAAARSGRLALDLVSANPADGEVGAAVAVAAAQLLPFVDFRKLAVEADTADHLRPAQTGVPLWWGVSSEPDALRRWLTPLLEPGSLTQRSSADQTGD